ncbi:IS630 family transposase [Candidatus Parcubacteria bacterium]|nr:IS630 family transposase [Candidatus Parcubacteria bacterium]
MQCKKLTIIQKQELQAIINYSKSSGREVRRAQSVLLLDQEMEIEAIIALTNYSRRQIFDLRKNYLNNGIIVIHDKKKGKPKHLLTKKQLAEVIKIVKEKTPKDYKYDSDFWTTLILGDLIDSQYKIKYRSKTSIYLIFKEAKFTFHKPDRLYQARNEEEVQKWKKKAKIKVKKALAEKNTVVLTADEMSLSTQTTIQKVWLPQGEYPHIEVATKRASRSIYGFLNIKTGKETAFKTKWQNMYITYDILGELRKVYPKQKLFLIWDKAPWHKGSRAQQFIKEDGNIETFDFPRAAPDENPQEHVWKNGRSKITHNKFIDNIDKATDDFVNYLNNTTFNYSFLDLKI